MTTFSPELKFCIRSLIADLARRLTRFLLTATPTSFATTKPNRAWVCDPSRFMYTTMWSATAFRPVLMVERKSSAERSRFSRASKVGYADSSVRPLRRRAARIARPARVFIRRRKPWVFARRRVFGWKVRLVIWCYSKASGEFKSKVFSWLPANPKLINLLNLRQYDPAGQVIWDIFYFYTFLFLGLFS